MYPKPILGPGLCECGCGQTPSLAVQTQTSAGRVKGQRCRFVFGHSIHQGPVAFWSKVPTGLSDEECWPWQGAFHHNGYGRFGKFRAHRASYEHFVGPIPTGLTIDHLCRNRACVNPAHMEPVTAVENMMRGNAPAAINSRKTHCIRGHALSGENLYVKPDGRRECRECQRTRALAA